MPCFVIFFVENESYLTQTLSILVLLFYHRDVKQSIKIGFTSQ